MYVYLCVCVCVSVVYVVFVTIAVLFIFFFVCTLLVYSYSHFVMVKVVVVIIVVTVIVVLEKVQRHLRSLFGCFKAAAVCCCCFWLDTANFALHLHLPKRFFFQLQVNGLCTKDNNKTKIHFSKVQTRKGTDDDRKREGERELSLH